MLVVGDETPFLVVKVNGAAQFIMGGQGYRSHWKRWRRKRQGANFSRNIHGDHNGAEHPDERA
jgi:hypothetical protein